MIKDLSPRKKHLGPEKNNLFREYISPSLENNVLLLFGQVSFSFCWGGDNHFCWGGKIIIEVGIIISSWEKSFCWGIAPKFTKRELRNGPKTRGFPDNRPMKFKFRSEIRPGQPLFWRVFGAFRETRKRKANAPKTLRKTHRRPEKPPRAHFRPKKRTVRAGNFA